MMIDIIGSFWYTADKSYYNIVYFTTKEKNLIGYTRRGTNVKEWDHCIKEDWN